MNTLNKLTLSLSAFAALFATTACSEIDSDDRLVELPAVETQRTVLLEEFTGQFCINCPAAHTIIANLTEQYPDNLIAVSIHAGGDAFSIGEGQLDGITGLRLQEGENYASQFGVKAFPSGIVNRTSGVLTSYQWAAAIRTAVQTPAKMDIKVDAKLSADGKAIEIATEIDPYENLNANLQLWVVENNIQAIQSLPNDVFEENYVHNHVFRGTVNGQQGEPVSLEIRKPEQFAHTIDLKSNWNPDNLSIVAFVYTSSGVEQAAYAHVGK